MTDSKFSKERKDLLKIKSEQEKAINIKYTALCDEFILKNSSVKNLEVYELLENGNKRRGFKRFVIYEQQIQVFCDSPMIKVGGWWLDKENIPKKWDTMTVYGVGNPAIFKISDNQNHLKHPDSTNVD